MAGKERLDMSQYSNMFETCRVPAPDYDKMVFPDKKCPAKHIAVVHKNNVCISFVLNTLLSCFVVSNLKT